ncbi:MAG: Do family serine endopeptidase [Bacteroidales bacterium]|nr:Do family serine endopeptidase [Candidatus Equimonas faecalis]
MKKTLLSFLAFAMSMAVMAIEHVDLTGAAEQAVNSVVYIKVTVNSKTQTVEYFDPFEDFFSDPFGDFFGRGQGNGKRQRQVETPKKQGSGSGVILSEDGYIVTNSHVVEGADEILVKMNDNREFAARIIGSDKSTDLALIKVEEKGLPAIRVADSNTLKVGEWVLAIGNPYGLTSTVTAGIVSAKARSLGARQNSIESFIQTDAAINPGNSGGALVNADGALVGINAMLYSQTGSFTGYGFAIPSSMMNKVVADLKEFGMVQRAKLGIQYRDVSAYIDEQHGKDKEVDLGTVSGAYIEEVAADGAAEEAGLEKGDVIVSIDGKEITKSGDLQEIIAVKQPGDKVPVVYLRNKKRHTATVTLLNEQGKASKLEIIDEEGLGASLRPVSEQEKKELALSHGLVVRTLTQGKMKAAGIEKDLIIQKVNGKEMRTVDDFNAVVKAANLSTDRVLEIRAVTKSGIKKMFLVELEDPKKK